MIREPDKIKLEDQFNLGNKFLDNGKIDQAIVCYRYAIEFNPTFDHPYCQLGLALSQKEHFTEAILAYQKAIELNPDFIWSYYALREAYQAVKQENKAVSTYRRFIAINPKIAAGYFNLGIILKEMDVNICKLSPLMYFKNT